MNTEIAVLNEKIDHLTEQVSLLTSYMAEQRKQIQAMNELKHDVIPMVNQMIKISIDELAEIGNDFQAEDLLFLVKRLLRNTNNLIQLLERMEGAMGLADETKLWGQQVFNNTVETLDMLERKGYFRFATGAGYIAERVVSEFDEEDVRALGDNIVTILQTVRNMTQPEVLAMVNNTVNAVQAPTDEADISTWALIKELSDPKVRKGMARMLNMLKVFSEQPTVNGPN
jgi:uncharacterized protein YjgD (DUF1641 family)